MGQRKAQMATEERDEETGKREKSQDRMATGVRKKREKVLRSGVAVGSNLFGPESEGAVKQDSTKWVNIRRKDSTSQGQHLEKDRRGYCSTEVREN